jgi:hypothetical protein
MVPKELVWKLYFELAQSEYRSGSMVPTFDQLTRHCTAGCTALRPRVAAQLPLLRSDRSVDRSIGNLRPSATQVQCKAALAQAVMSCPQSVRWKACPAGSI